MKMIKNIFKLVGITGYVGVFTYVIWLKITGLPNPKVAPMVEESIPPHVLDYAIELNLPTVEGTHFHKEVQKRRLNVKFK